MRVSRRSVLVSSVGALVVAAFDPRRRAWLSVANADAPDAVHVPKLDGELAFDAATLAEASRDFGGIIEHAPWAVLRPASVGDVAAVIRFARRHGLSVAMRGQAHSVFGQAQAAAGIVIDSRTLATVHTIDANGAWVDAGVTWRELLTQATAADLTPPVLTDYLDRSVGGVLSVGGIGGATHRFGFVADNCLELEVVTGQGVIVRCSADRHARLFDAVLGGLGQCAIIVRARIALKSAKPLARVHQLTYLDLDAFLRDQRIACDDERFDFLQGLVALTPAGDKAFIMQGARWYAPDAPPSDSTALAGLTPTASEVQDLPYAAWAARVDANVAQWKAAGVWTTPHPWCDLFLPDDQINAFAARALAELAPADLGAGVILLYPFKRRPLTRPLVRVPGTDTLWLFDLLRVSGPGTTAVDTLLAKNRELLERAVANGGKRYPISAVGLTPDDYPLHYDELWSVFTAAKRTWDPDRILTPGQSIFRA